MSTRLKKKKVLALIDEAFRDVRLGNGVSLHETIEIDDSRAVLKNSTARKNDETQHWKKLISMTEFQNMYGVGGIHFFDSEGIRFHLTAYLTLAVRDRLNEDVFESLIFVLTDIGNYSKGRFKILTLQQCNCVRNVLVFLHESDICSLSDDVINKVVDDFWAE